MRWLLVALACTSLSSLGTGCGNAPAADLSDPASRRSTMVKVGMALSGRVIKVGVAVDKTGSSAPNGVSPVGMEDFEQLVGIIKVSGGEAGVGSIRETSNRPLLRLRIDPPTNGSNAPESTNLYERMETSAQTDSDLQQRELLVEGRVETFKKQLAGFLKEAPDAQRSAVCEAVRRIDLFLSEEDPWRTEVEKYAIFITDGEENVEASPCEPLSARATILLIRGGNPGRAFERMPSKSFESLSAALAWIEAQKGSDS